MVPAPEVDPARAVVLVRAAQEVFKVNLVCINATYSFSCVEANHEIFGLDISELGETHLKIALLVNIDVDSGGIGHLQGLQCRVIMTFKSVSTN